MITVYNEDMAFLVECSELTAQFAVDTYKGEGLNGLWFFTNGLGTVIGVRDGGEVC